jgi:hypothetical protein
MNLELTMYLNIWSPGLSDSLKNHSRKQGAVT